MVLPGNIDNVISPSSLRTDPLEELLQGRNQQGGLALPEEVHEHYLLLQSQVQQAQAVEHRRLQVLLTCRGRARKHGVRKCTNAHTHRVSESQHMFSHQGKVHRCPAGVHPPPAG